ncbi:SAM-dependent methyltransferase [Ciceribacter thiooxidans]|uniref:Class I SAM-dependent methyltransferase n=1 Tax=Ciceribacter thiooxidans TaxID=1969821 RepID=A0ABV7I2I3_9HYPH|nr:cyclopropane-fatty-acyl-phospholipid synthase family protein [Ciceribacter thiooxidans]
MTSKLEGLLNRIVRTGTLTATTADGQSRNYGDGTGEPIAIRFTDQKAENELVDDPQLKLGEIYMDGRMVMDAGDIYDLLALVKSNTLAEDLSPGMIWRGVARLALTRLQRLLPFNHNQRNVAHHYDLSAKLFDLFLDPDWQYSCAYFETPETSLEEAQVAKKRHIAAKLLLDEGQRVLEIGSGWGGMAMYLAESSGVDVTGITLSTEQLRVSRDRAEKRGLSSRVRFELQDYRTMKAKPFDRIVSVGMFEHVGPSNYGRFFRKAAELLDEDGVMLLHSIGQPTPPLVNNPFFEKYIFPGGYIPSLAEVLPAVQKAGLFVRDIEIMPRHYARTLRLWRERFLARKEEVIRLYDERFVRMWEFYLAGSEMAFTHQGFFIFQMQLARNTFAVPDTRGYMAEREASLAVFDATRPPLEKVTY